MQRVDWRLHRKGTQDKPSQAAVSEWKWGLCVQLVLFGLVALAGCGDEGVANTSETGANNGSPTISGNAPTSVNQDENYLFGPTANDPDGDTLMFTIVNKPLWANFDTSTGTLAGTPLRGDVGAFGDIVISVSDDFLSDSLEPFSITVMSTLQSITVTPANFEIPAKKIFPLSVTGSFSNKPDEAIATGITWESSNEGVATVNSAGEVFGASPGQSAITVSDNATGNFDVSTITVASLPEFWTTQDVTPIILPGYSKVQRVDVFIPEPSVAIGILVEGANFLKKVIDHGEIFTDSNGDPMYITDPNGVIAPLSFNQKDKSPIDGVLENSTTMLIDHQSVALFFPNDGSIGNFVSGTYQVPIGLLDANSSCCASNPTDDIEIRLFYKLPTNLAPTLGVTIFVISGVGGITTAEQARNNPEILGAINFIRKIYEWNPIVALDLVIDIDVVPDTGFAILETESEFGLLNMSYPDPPTHDSINIFVVSEIAFPSSNVVGYSSHTPGPFDRHETYNSGILGEYQNDGNGRFLGSVMSHELGHHLGLLHTTSFITEGGVRKIRSIDPLSDTPTCEVVINSGGDVADCPDRTNLMFSKTRSDSIITPQQATVIRLNPALR